MKARDVLETLGSDEAVANLTSWVRLEREATAQVIAHLAILERDQIHVAAGFSSLFTYCHEKLGYSRDASYKRSRAAKAALAHPEILDHLESGELSLSGLLILAKHLTGSAVGAELLERARGRSCRAIEAMLAAWFPGTNSPRGEFRARPVGDALVRIEVVVPTEVAEKLELARDIDRHRNPEGDVATILDESLTLFIAAVEKRKHAATDSPRRAPDERPTQAVPAHVRRKVHQRDEGRCQFEGTERVCGERAFVEFDHIKPRAQNGAHSVENGRLLCAVHNDYEAQQRMGSDVVARGRRRRETEKELLAALVRLGLSRAESKTRAQRAFAELGPDAELEALYEEVISAYETRARPG